MQWQSRAAICMSNVVHTLLNNPTYSIITLLILYTYGTVVDNTIRSVSHFTRLETLGTGTELKGDYY